MALAALFLVPSAVMGAELTAGDVDDNLNFDYYRGWAQRARENNSALPALELGDRVLLRIENETGVPVPNAQIAIRVEGQERWLVGGHAGTDGVFALFPTWDGAGSAQRFEVQVMGPEGSAHPVSIVLDLARLGVDRTLHIALASAPTALPTRLDVMLVIDTTGSMGDEIRYLKTELAGIIANLTVDHPGLNITYGGVAYRDQGDDYVVKDFPLQASLDDLLAWLKDQGASGGGDTPEAMQVGLEHGVRAAWRSGNVARALVLVADAPPHNGDMVTFMDNVRQARRTGVQIFPLAASGADDAAEYVMRAAAVLTGGRFMFLTDDSGIGIPHSLPHIECYQVTSLSNLITRVFASEIAGVRVEALPSQVIRAEGNMSAGVCIDPATVGPPAPLGTFEGPDRVWKAPPKTGIADGHTEGSPTAGPAAPAADASLTPGAATVVRVDGPVLDYESSHTPASLPGTPAPSLAPPPAAGAEAASAVGTDLLGWAALLATAAAVALVFAARRSRAP